MATTTASTQQPGHKEPFPPFNAETYASQLFWLALCFVFLLVMMSKVALPRIGRIIEEREGAIAGDLAEAERLRGESDAALQGYEKALADARTRAQAIATEMREKQRKEAEASRKALEDQLNAKQAEADKSIAATKTVAMGNIRSIAADTAKAIVERLIGKAPDDNAVQAAVADVVKQ